MYIHTVSIVLRATHSKDRRGSTVVSDERYKSPCFIKYTAKLEGLVNSCVWLFQFLWVTGNTLLHGKTCHINL